VKFSKAFLIFAIFCTAFLGGLSVHHFKESFAHFKARTDVLSARAIDIQGKITQAIKEKKEREYTLLFAGDVMLSRAVGRSIEKYGGGDYRYPFLKIAGVVRSADFAFANLESPISSRGKNQGSIYSFRADPKVVEGLVFAGFDALSIANNHIWDWGREALEDTIHLLSAGRIVPFGAGVNYSDANEPKFLSVGSLRLALLGYTNLMPRSLEATASRAGLSQFEPELIRKKIFDTRNQADIIIVSMHWGDEYEASANTLQKSLARQFIDAGADLVIGHHPHVIQEVEKYKQGWIAYSLGNFVFDQRFSDATKQGLMLRVGIRDRKVASVEEIKIGFSETFQPFVAVP
jgi:poly-gamma-glutamate synthesis protein (capsule biosynthesis protein)